MVTHSGVEAFLAICRTGSISRAADELFVCQSSLSIRLKTLENELGTALFLRKKGQREVALTDSGKEFYEIALAYEKVIHRIEKLRQQHHKTLAISSLNSLGAYILPESYGLFMEKYPDVRLVIQDCEFAEACKNILQDKTDLAFNAGNRVPDRIRALPVFEEEFALICSKESSYPETVSVDMLQVKNEVYVAWDVKFEDYLTAVFGTESPQLRLDIMSQLKIFVEKPNYWALVPASVAQGLEQIGEIRRLKAKFALPKRTVYCLCSEEIELDSHSILFLRCLTEILKQKKEITCLLEI